MGMVMCGDNDEGDDGIGYQQIKPATKLQVREKGLK